MIILSWGSPMELSLTGIKSASISVLTHLGSSDLAEQRCDGRAAGLCHVGTPSEAKTHQRRISGASLDCHPVSVVPVRSAGRFGDAPN
jgi:hypothetical protein